MEEQLACRPVDRRKASSIGILGFFALFVPRVSPAQAPQSRTTACSVWKISGLGGTSSAIEVRSALQAAEKSLMAAIEANTARNSEDPALINHLIVVRQLRLNVAEA